MKARAQYSEAEAACEVGVSVEQLRALIRLHIVRNDEDLGTVPVAGITLLLGVDRFMSEMRSLTNLAGNAVATIVVAKWEKEFDTTKAAAIQPDSLSETPQLVAK